MTVLIIFSVILLIILGVLFIPVTVDLEYNEDFKIRVSFLKIILYKNGKKTKNKENKTEEKAQKKEKQKNSTLNDAKKYFADIKKKKGFAGAVTEVMALVSELFSHIKKLLKFIYICNVKLDVTVGTEDAAKTALDYGIICNAVYPVTAYLDSMAHIDFKEINLKTDFEGQKCRFAFKGKVKIQIFYLLICAFRIFTTLKKFINGENENER